MMSTQQPHNGKLNGSSKGKSVARKRADSDRQVVRDNFLFISSLSDIDRALNAPITTPSPGDSHGSHVRGAH